MLLHLLFSFALRAKVQGGRSPPLDTFPFPEKPETIPPSPLHGRGGRAAAAWAAE